MRDLLVTLVVFGSLPFILRQPSIGVLMWCWISYMNPHRLAWGFAYSFPFAMVVAIVTLVGMLVSPEKKRWPSFTVLTVLWILFFLWTGVTSVMAVYPEEAIPKFVDFAKVQLMTVVTVMLMSDRKRIDWLVWAIVLSIGFYGVKGGIFVLTTGGINRVWGPPNSFIGDNNALALALLMLLPLVYYLRTRASFPLVRHGLLAAMILMAAAAVGSYSRGGFLAGFCMAAMLWLKSRSKILTGVVVATLIPLFFAFMPQHWHDRMNTISTYEEDRSAMNRVEAWTLSYNTANRRFFGGGFEMWTAEMWQSYGPRETFKAPGNRGAHSIYFGVLGEHGWVGLFLFVSVFVAAWRTGSWIVRHTEGVEDLEWLRYLARMIQVSFVAYATGGAFQSLAYWDYPWHLVAILVIGRGIVERHAAAADELKDDSPRRALILGRPRVSGAHFRV